MINHQEINARTTGAAQASTTFDFDNYNGAFKYLKRGGYWLFDSPEHSKWDWRGMAESLGMINRYDGATHYPYSVAQHCCLGHDYAPPEIRFHFLMHDLPEVIIGDKTQPVKDNEARQFDRLFHSLQEVMDRAKAEVWLQREIELGFVIARRLHAAEDERVLRTLYRRAGVPLPNEGECAAIKTVDQRMLATEVRDLMETPPASLQLNIPGWIAPYPHAIKQWSWDKAADEFLKRLALYIKV
ncbi:hypothetical protein SAMN04515647_3679 [Cohaesibacter sp. ES.047]|uniref:hypothetical protein n=1 Tax=Cohaesibacter sp. ES.047 TaxID=1798205 RepID=UPI000BB77F11|nr:hypothetical protein [Cohaesibacter sp. ES.047]SNY93384.1 hypothetical protein SAMN04515647_3679 [Cohaesibacter sp. ES.047]